MADITQRISLSKPPVKQSMYKTLYMMDYTPYAKWKEQLPMMDLSQKLQLEAQLKKKEFERLAEKKPMKYTEEPICQEVKPPYPIRMDEGLSKSQEVPPASQQVQEDPEKQYLPSGPTVVQQKEAKSIVPETDALAVPDFVTTTDESTYQRDYKYWPRVRGGFYQANRNFSNFIFHDGYYNENPWASEYMDNYSIFLRKLNWKTQNTVSTFCSAVRPISHLSPEMPTQTSIAVNTAL